VAAIAAGIAWALAVAPTARAGDWAEFMGPGRNHISTETGLRSTFGADGPAVLWRANVGLGYSGVSVASGRAFTLGHKDGRETLFAFDAQTGETLWMHTYPAELLPLFHTGGPNAAPTVREGRVYSLSKDGQVHCLEAATGKPIWRSSLLEPMGLKEMTRWGFASAPRFHEGRLYFLGSRVLALDPATGKVAMATSNVREAGYGSVEFFEHDGRKLMAALSGTELVIYDSGTGAEIVTHPFPVEYNTNCITPMIVREDGRTTIFIAASNRTGRCEKLLFDGRTLTRVYGNEHMRNFMNNAVLLDGYLYGIDGKHKNRNTRLVCMRYRDGQLMWSQGGVGCGSVLAADGRLLVLTEDGRLLIAPVSPEAFKPTVEAAVLTGTCWTPLSLANGLLYARNEAGDVACLDLRR
jgi:outer membrane protein assembly factor BamB